MLMRFSRVSLATRTFHYKSKKMRAASVDTNAKVLEVAPYTDLVYPVFPDMTHEVPTLFSARR
jgi:hypothetical protein